MNYTAPARLGMPVKVYLYRTPFDVPVGRGTAAVLVEAFLLVFVSVAVLFAGILTLFDRGPWRAPASALAGLVLLGVTTQATRSPATGMKGEPVNASYMASMTFRPCLRTVEM